MIRKIIEIDEDKCDGCGICVAACDEGAIALIDGKARLVRDDYCDGLGDCLPSCPMDAIQIIERKAAAFDPEAVKKRQAELKSDSFSCPGLKAKELAVEDSVSDQNSKRSQSLLRQWPVQIKLMPVKAPYYDNARLLIAADCCAYAYGSFHQDFINNHIAIIGCPKLDMVDYTEKLTEIIRQNEIKSVTIVRMSVPCCGGLEFAAKRALQASGKFIPWQIVTITPEGKILD